MYIWTLSKVGQRLDYPSCGKVGQRPDVAFDDNDGPKYVLSGWNMIPNFLQQEYLSMPHMHFDAVFLLKEPMASFSLGRCIFMCTYITILNWLTSSPSQLL